MIKKINSKTIKLIKYYNLINYNLIYNNKQSIGLKKISMKYQMKKLENLKI